MLLALLAFLWQAQPAAIDPALVVQIQSSKDGAMQPAVFYAPSNTGKPVPLVVFLHSWSTDYKTVGPALEEARRMGWAFVGPDFRGKNDTPQACASDLAVQDIVDSVAYAKRTARVDDKRVYLVGSSGGGHISLLMVTPTPALWSAVSTWVPITDLEAWYECSKATGS